MNGTYSVNHVVYLIRTKNKMQNHSFHDLFHGKMSKLAGNTMLFTCKHSLNEHSSMNIYGPLRPYKHDPLFRLGRSQCFNMPVAEKGVETI